MQQGLKTQFNILRVSKQQELGEQVGLTANNTNDKEMEYNIEYSG